MYMNNNLSPTKLRGHLSPAMVHEGLVYFSGLLSIDYQGGKTQPEGGIEEQTRQVLINLERVLAQFGSSKQQVIKTTIYIPDVSCWPIVNALYADFFGEHKPARTIVPTTPLHYGALIEIEAIAST